MTGVAGKESGFTLFRRANSLSQLYFHAITREIRNIVSSSFHLNHTTSKYLRAATRSQIIDESATPCSIGGGSPPAQTGR